MPEHLWSLVLGSGDVSRALASDTAPKQFRRLDTDHSLFEATLARADALGAPERTVAVVTSGHMRFWSSQLTGRPFDNIIVQVASRGSAVGVLLGLDAILARDPDADVVLLPSDQHVTDETTFAHAVRRALKASRQARCVVALGVIPEGPAADLDWIVPAAQPSRGLARVARVVERASAEEARRLMALGAVVSPEVLVGRAEAFHALFEAAVPAFTQDVDGLVASSLSNLWLRNADLSRCDFASDVLARSLDHVRVMPAPPCGWSTVVTQEHLRQALHAPPTDRKGKRPRVGTLQGVAVALTARPEEPRARVVA